MYSYHSHLDKIRIQLKWYPNAAFAGIFVAKYKGFFTDEGIDAKIISGEEGTKVDQLVAHGYADFGVSSLDSVMQQSTFGLPVVSIAQIFQGSSQGVATLKASGIDSIPRLAGKTIGTFGGVNELQLYAFLKKFYLIDSIKLALQQSMDDLLTKKVDGASIGIYNHLQPPYKEGLEPENMIIILFSKAGVGMLEDTLITHMQIAKYKPDLCERVVRAILRGWWFTFKSPNETTDIVMHYVPKNSTTKVHQSYMLKAVQNSILPKGLNLDDIGSFQSSSIINTADTLLRYELIRKPVQINQVVVPSIVDKVMRGA